MTWAAFHVGKKGASLAPMSCEQGREAVGDAGLGAPTREEKPEGQRVGRWASWPAWLLGLVLGLILVPIGLEF